MPIGVHELLEAAQSCGLLSVDQVQQLTGDLSRDGTMTLDDAAQSLIDRRALTRYQIDQLLAGHVDECVLAERYQIRARVGAGAMGAVYGALDTKLERTVAIKVLPPKSVNDQDAVARFQREAKALAQLSHPNIVQAYDADRDGDRHFLVMEYVEGRNLAQLLREKGCLPGAIAADYAYQAACGLEHAHEKGLVHRDIKPGNLFLTMDGQLKILDLGLARYVQDQIAEEGLTREGMGMGTPDYAAPEQWRSAHDVDARADIYSLGCTLYHLLAGQVPFPGTSMTEKLESHQRKQPVPLEERCPETPVGLSFVIQKMMAKHPADRFRTAREAAEALAPYVAGSSTAMADIRATASWHGSQLSTRFTRPKLKAGKTALAAAVAVLALLALLALAVPTIFRKDNSSSGNEPPEKTVVTIPNGLTVAQNGTGQYTEINGALQDVRPGMTIRVLDQATYTESLVIDDPQRFDNVTLEAQDKATLVVPDGAPRGVFIRDVRGFRFEGFLLREESSGGLRPFIFVSGKTPGTTLKELDIQARGEASGIIIASVDISDGERPVIVERCLVRGCTRAIDVTNCKGVCVRNNMVVGCHEGLQIKGAIAHAHITGNIVGRCLFVAIDIEELKRESQGVLIANNTLNDGQALIRVYDYVPYEEYVSGQITFCNNLLFGATNADMVLLHSQKEMDHPMPADGGSLVELWNFKCNWRDFSGVFSDVALPLAPGDNRFDKPEIMTRDESDPDFLRPVKGSPLATGGAGNDDPSLPAYVGAVPPEGVEPWNWDKTWEARSKPAANKEARSDE